MAALDLTKNGLDLTKEPIVPEQVEETPKEETPAKSVATTQAKTRKRSTK